MTSVNYMPCLRRLDPSRAYNLWLGLLLYGRTNGGIDGAPNMASMSMLTICDNSGATYNDRDDDGGHHLGVG